MGKTFTFALASMDEVLTQLLNFYSNVENYLLARLPYDVWSQPSQRQGAKKAIDMHLRTLVKSDLQKKLPGIEISWDNQIDIPAIYSMCSVAVVDLVDGAAEYARHGTAVTSHLGIYKRTSPETMIGEMQLGIVSYPFHQFRIIVKGDEDKTTYYVPFEYDLPQSMFAQRLNKCKIVPLCRNIKRGIHIVDRYQIYDQNDPIRRSLDKWRHKLINTREGTYVELLGSVAKTIVDVALGVSDVAICRHSLRATQEPRMIPYYDYLTPWNVLKKCGGVLTDLRGRSPTDQVQLEGFIAAASPKIYSIFFDSFSRDG